MFRRWWLGCIVGMLSVSAWAADGVLVAAGAGYRKPVLELLQAFSEATGIKAEASFGNMKQVEVQARQNPDISVLIGDQAFLEPMQLAQQFMPLGRGQLVLVAASGKTLQTLDDLRGPAIGRIAMPDREKAVYGKAAFTCMQRSGLWADIHTKLIEVTTVPQVSAYVLTQQVDAGFVNATEAKALQGKVGAAVVVDEGCYPPIALSMGVIAQRGNVAAVQALQAFVGTPAARAVLQRHGL